MTKPSGKMWVPTVGMVDQKPTNSFEAAFKVLFDWICSRESLTLYALETCWVWTPDSLFPMDFHTARDQAVDLGLIVNGKWAK